MQKLISSLIIASIMMSSGCATGRPAKSLHTKNWHTATREVVRQYRPYVDPILNEAFKRAHVRYPSQRITLLAFKAERRIEVWALDRHKRWHFIKQYPITAASGGPGPKLREYDYQIPEGIYKIQFLNPFSQLHLSMRLNYPNAYDRAHAKIDHRKQLGQDIYIHGGSMSVGCIAIGDKAIEELFVLVATTGTANTKVIIAPNDLRRYRPLPVRHPTTWLADLDQHIASALRPYRTYSLIT